MKSSVYLETSVISYLSARMSRDLIVASHQQISQEWWETRHNWDISISALVIAEARAGNMEAAKLRLTFIQHLPLLQLNDSVTQLAEHLLIGTALPQKAREDALHIAIAAVHGVDYLLTWNCRHIANAAKRPLIEAICATAGFKSPIICTPEELLGEHNVD